MKELLNNIKTKNVEDMYNFYLVDTCFLVNSVSHPEKIRQISNTKNIGITSFNAEELVLIEHKLNERTRSGIRTFLKNNKNLFMLNIDVHPKCAQLERCFVNKVDLNLLKLIHDPSDAVLIAAAINTKSNVLTKDKHHLYTVVLENFLNKYGIKVLNKLP